MTHNPDEPDDPADSGSAARGEGAGRKLDEDAAWREIVEHYDDPPAGEPGPGVGAAGSGTDPEVEPGTAPVDPFDELQAPPTEAPKPPVEHPDERLRGLFQPSWNDPLESAASWNDEGHFVPPTPPPMPVLDPRRRAAWVGLFGSPVLMLLAVVLGWSLPDWLMFALAASFIGGFVYLVATMPSGRGGGPGDDGAVV